MKNVVIIILAAQAVMLGLKLFGFVDLDWWEVFIPVLLFCGSFAIALVSVFITDTISDMKNR